MELNRIPEHSSVNPEGRYAAILLAVSRAGLALLALGFLAYFSGLLQPRVLPVELPALWSKPAQEYLAAARITSGWGWLLAVPRGDTAPLLGIALIALSPLFSLLGVLPLYWRERGRKLAWITALLVGLLTLAASGLIGARN